MSNSPNSPREVLFAMLQYQLKLGEVVANVNARLSKLEITVDTLTNGEMQQAFRNHFEADQKRAEELQEVIHEGAKGILAAMEKYIDG